MASSRAMFSLSSLQTRPPILHPFRISRSPNRRTFFPEARPKPHRSHSSITAKTRQQTKAREDDAVPFEDVKFIAKFRSRYNYIRVLEVSRRADHPLAGSRLLLLDAPGNIHSISFLFKPFTGAYYDVFATLPPIIPPGPIAILGFGAGSTARLILELYPDTVVHGWELDPSVIAVGREYFGLDKLEKKYPDRLFIYIADALTASVNDGFSGILVDLFSEGSLIPQLQDPNTWVMLTRCLKKGGRVMVNVGGSCVEAEDKRRDGKVVMEDTLKAMHRVFGDRLFVSTHENHHGDSSVALTGKLPDLEAWKKLVAPSLRRFVDIWTPFSS